MSGAAVGLERGYGGAESGTNPITVQQKIVYTALPDSGLSRRDNSEPPFYGGDVDSDNMRILRGEPCIMERSISVLTIGAITRETQLVVFSCLNQYGNKNRTKAEHVRELTWGGFAGNDSLEDHDAGEKDRRAFPVFLGGSFTITNNGPDVWFTGDLIYWDLPNNDAEALSIGRSIGRSKSRPMAKGRRTVVLRKYAPEKQAMTKKAIRETNSTSDLSLLRDHGVGRTEQYSKSHVDFFDTLKKVFLLGAIAQQTGQLQTGTRKDSLLAAIRDKRNDKAIADMAVTVGLQSSGGVKLANAGVHNAILALLMPMNKEERMYEPKKGRRTPGSPIFNPGEKVLKQIQGGGATDDGLLEANVTEHLLAAVAQAQHEISSRVVGKCISSSKSGGDTDIISFSM